MDAVTTVGTTISYLKQKKIDMSLSETCITTQNTVRQILAFILPRKQKYVYLVE